MSSSNTSVSIKYMTREVILQFKEKMKPTIRIFSGKMKIIDPQRKKNIFSIFAQKSLVIETVDTEKIDTELLIELPENYSAYLTTKFENQNIKEFIGPCKKKTLDRDIK